MRTENIYFVENRKSDHKLEAARYKAVKLIGPSLLKNSNSTDFFIFFEFKVLNKFGANNRIRIMHNDGLRDID